MEPKTHRHSLTDRLFAKVCVIVLSCFVLMSAAACGKNDSVKPVSLNSYWTKDSVPAAELNTYLAAVTNEKSEDFIPVEDRIAVFDLDGTLMCETCPWCFEYMVFADYALNGKSENITEDIQAVANEILDSAWGEKPEGMSTRQAEAGARAYAGMTPAELQQLAGSFRKTAIDGFSGLTWEEAYYLPMKELFDVLIENNFTVYIVTATERNIVRGITEGILNIPPSHIIGTEYGYTATGQGDTEDDEYTFSATDKVVMDGEYFGENAKMCKVDAIVREIGQQPVLAFGNSSGDLAMLMYTITNNPYKSAAYMVMADDDVREYGDPESSAKKAEGYRADHIGIISMKTDFATIYKDDAKKTR